MKFAKQQLVKYHQSPLAIEEQLDLQSLIDERFSDLILQAKNVTIKGTIQTLEDDDIVLVADVHADLILPSSRSLEPVDWSTDIQIQETYVESEERLEKFDDDEPVFLLENNSLDVDAAVLDNLIAALPIQIFTPAEEAGEELPTGQDWQVIQESDEEQQARQQAEDNQNNEKKLDPRLSKLDDFFK